MEKKFDGGSIKYRLPNVVEGLRMVGKIKKNLPPDWLEEGETILLAETIANMSMLFEEIKLDDNAATFDELLAYKPARTVIIEIADSLISELFLEEKKSEQSPTI